MLKKPTRYSTELLFEEIRMLPVAKLYLLAVLKYTYKNTKYLTFTDHNYETRNNQQQMANIPRMNKTFGQRSFVYYAPKVYNRFKQYLSLQNIHISNYNFKKIAKQWIYILSWQDVNQMYNKN